MMEASDLTATQDEIATVARFLVWRGSQIRPCAEPEAIYDGNGCQSKNLHHKPLKIMYL